MPFDPQGVLSEERLAVPLVVKFPGGDLNGRDEPLAVGAADVSATVLTSLGLPVPDYFEGADLYAAAHGRVPVVTPPSVATAPGRYATRLGSWLLRGEAENCRLCARSTWIPRASTISSINGRSPRARCGWRPFAPRARSFEGRGGRRTSSPRSSIRTPSRR